MQMERPMISNWNYKDGKDYDYGYHDDHGTLDQFSFRETSPLASSSPGFIDHRISKLDTLAGVAIKYGVEVSDIKKMNNLVTDFQMFGRRSLHIPSPGRHPPSPGLSKTPSNEDMGHYDAFDSFKTLKVKSKAMSSLQGYYGLKDGNDFGDVLYLTPTPSSNPPLNRHRKSRSLVNTFADDVEGNLNSETLLRRRQKSTADDTTLLKDTVFSAAREKGLALRIKASRAAAVDHNSTYSDGYSSRVRKSSSTPSLQDQETNNTSSFKKPPLLLKPLSILRNKAALD